MPANRILSACLIPVSVLLFFSAGSEAAGRKDLWSKQGRLVWGTSPEDLIGLSWPTALRSDDDAQAFVAGVRQIGVAGGNTILIPVQSPGQPFFSPDGKSTPPESADRLRKVVEAARDISANPILLLFDPDPSCRLQSEQAYRDAAVWTVEALREENGFILAISDRCDDPRWQTGTFAFEDIGATERIAAAVGDASPDRIVAAGANDPEVFDALLNHSPSVGAILAPVSKLGLGQGPLSSKKKPTIEIIDTSEANDEDLKQAVTLVEQEAYGRYAFVLTDTSSPDQSAVRERFRLLNDQLEKASTPSTPPDLGNTFSLKPGEQEEGFISLFNGKDLSGWVVLSSEGNFVVEDGAIVIKRRSGGWLRSWDAYKDYVLRAEYRITEGQNSGIFNRAALNARNSRIGFEFQIFGEPGADPQPYGTGSIYGIKAPEENRMRPTGEWNEVEITCQGPHVKVVWNGAVVHDVDYDDFDALRYRVLEGYIGLQDHRGGAEFRSLRIKPLE